MTHYSAQVEPAPVAAAPKATSPWGNTVAATPGPAKGSKNPFGDFPPVFKVIDLGEISQDKFESILDQMSKAWGRDIAPLMVEKPKTFKEQLKSDVTNAAYRVGSTQVLTITKNFLVQFAGKSCSEESKIRAFSELLDTEIGTALMAMFIGFSVSQIPQLADSPKMQRILKEFRVSGMATVGNAAVAAILTSLLPVVSSALQGLEKTESSKKIEEVSSLEEEIILNSELENTAPLLRQS